MTTVYVTASALQNLPARRDFDFYPTPIDVCSDALTFLPDSVNPLNILDPGAGAGVWGTAARRMYPNALITGIDIRPETLRPRAYNFWMHGDFLLMNTSPCFDLVIGNPPYKYAEQFVRRSLDMLEDGGYLILLLRLNFLEGQDRSRRLHRKYPPKKVVVRAGRVSFTGDGKSNATAYGYFVWQKGYSGRTVLDWSLHS